MTIFLRSSFICILALAAAVSSRAQYTSDTLFFRDGTYMVGEIIDHDYEMVVFRTPDADPYMVRKSAIIKMYNGKQNLYSRYKISPKGRLNDVMPYPRNEMGITVFDLLRTDIRMYYEYRPLKTRLAIRLPFTFGFNSGNFNTAYSAIGIPTIQNINFALGIEPRIYSSKLSRHSYVFGVSAEYQYVNRSEYSGGDPWWNGHAVRVMIVNGSSHLVAGRVQLNTEAAIGVSVPVGDGFYNQGMAIPVPIPQFKLRFNVGYRW